MLPKNSCKGLSSGVYKIDIPVDPISALCEGDLDGGGWIVVHKRFNGSVDFNRNWSEYRNGFGNMEGEFFIGLENLQLGFYNGSVLFASYDHFRIGNETMKYKLESLGEFKGTAVNAMVHSLGEVFSTFDRDNDQWVGGNCAKTFSGAWWYENCSYV
ncbi:uncharacterized protein Dwil_GK27045 [Drosophila willistoni]|uniref:Fibrinogen C-terminal domain-containing protein n=1 Tax=Drosophila willistoni TaxID=7260 RepID=A0A0Q9WYC6_DROWI|nr:uncharacterized protein Dwil_GK27045 [Drosophila willistoni]